MYNSSLCSYIKINFFIQPSLTDPYLIERNPTWVPNEYILIVFKNCILRIVKAH
jgi:hypothetical protein